MYKKFEDNMIWVIDDFIDKEYQEKIKSIMLGSQLYFDCHPDGGVEFPWYIYRRCYIST